MQPLKLNGDAARTGGSGDLDGFQPSHRCRIGLTFESVGDSHSAQVDPAVTAMNGGKPGKTALEQLDRPPCLTELDPTCSPLDVDEFNRAVTPGPALAALLADTGQLQCVVQPSVAGGFLPGKC